MPQRHSSQLALSRATDVPLIERTSMNAYDATPHTAHTGFPAASGMYDPANERDACGLAAVVALTGAASHEIISLALGAL